MLTPGSKLRIGGYALLGAAGCALAIWGLSRWDQAHQAALTRQAGQHAAAFQAATQEAQIYRAQAEGFLADLNRLKSTATTQAKEIARIKAAKPQLLEAPQGVPDPCPDLRELAQRQDGLIQTQGLQLGTWEKRGIALEGQASASDRAAQACGQQVQTLTMKLNSLAVDRPWSAGPLLGVNAQGQLRFGVIASGAYGRVQGHALVLGDTAALGLTYRFGGAR